MEQVIFDEENSKLVKKNKITILNTIYKTWLININKNLVIN